MALVNMVDMLEKARLGKYAVGQFNINNLENITVCSFCILFFV